MTVKGGRVGILPLLALWALTAAAFIAKAWFTASSTPLILDSDDAMRLTEVRDFLGGQSWFDLIQHRLNTPFGASMHWSRLVDLPEAALLFLLRPFAGEAAESILIYLWPTLLLGPLLWLTARLALRLGRREAMWPALILPGLSLISLGEFAPGRLDHHSAQILLSLAIVYCTIAALERPRFAAGAAVAAAAALAIGIEGLPIVAIAAVVFALLWVADARHAAAMRDYGLAFACAMALALAQGVAPDDWLRLRIDAISIVYVVAAILCAIAFTTLSLLRLHLWSLRLIAALVAGVMVTALLLWLDPSILNGPYAALDPWLVQNWLSHVSEAQSWAQSFVEDPLYPLAVTVPVVAALAYAGWNVVRHPADRAAWSIIAAFLLVGLLVMLIQIRAARIVTPLAVAPTAALIATAWRRLVARPGIVPALAAVGSIMVSAGLVVAVVVALAPWPAPLGNGPAGDRRACLQPGAFASLATLPPQRLMAPIDLGSHLLLFTPHAVVAAPYHRNQQGLLDTLHFFSEPIDTGRAILAARGISLVVVCPAMSELGGTLEHAPDSFAALFAAGRLPDWLVAQSAPDAVLKVYAVKPR